jgi:hypothetical protein
MSFTESIVEDATLSFRFSELMPMPQQIMHLKTSSNQ